jgi:hypothetical protein
MEVIEGMIEVICYLTTLPVTRMPYTFPILSFRYLSSGRYKNDQFLKNVVRYLSSGISTT